VLERYEYQIKKLVNERKLVKEVNRIKIAPEYKFLSNQVIVEFI